MTIAPVRTSQPEPAQTAVQKDATDFADKLASALSIPNSARRLTQPSSGQNSPRASGRAGSAPARSSKPDRRRKQSETEQGGVSGIVPSVTPFAVTPLHFCEPGLQPKATNTDVAPLNSASAAKTAASSTAESGHTGGVVLGAVEAARENVSAMSSSEQNSADSANGSPLFHPTLSMSRSLTSIPHQDVGKIAANSITSHTQNGALSTNSAPIQSEVSGSNAQFGDDSDSRTVDDLPNLPTRAGQASSAIATQSAVHPSLGFSARGPRALPTQVSSRMEPRASGLAKAPANVDISTESEATAIQPNSKLTYDAQVSSTGHLRSVAPHDVKAPNQHSKDAHFDDSDPIGTGRSSGEPSLEVSWNDSPSEARDRRGDVEKSPMASLFADRDGLTAHDGKHLSSAGRARQLEDAFRGTAINGAAEQSASHASQAEAVVATSAELGRSGEGPAVPAVGPQAPVPTEGSISRGHRESKSGIPSQEATRKIPDYDAYADDQRLGIGAARLLHTPNTTEMHIRVRTEDVGDLHVRATIEHGQIAAAIAADRPEVRDAIAAQVPQLERALLHKNVGAEISVVGSGVTGGGDGGGNSPDQQRRFAPGRRAEANLGPPSDPLETPLDLEPQGHVGISVHA